MIEQIVGILLIFILAWASVRWKLFSDPLPKRPYKTEEEVHEKVKSQLADKSIDDTIDDLNKRYPDH